MKLFRINCKLYEYDYDFLVFCNNEDDIHEIEQRIKETELLNGDFGCIENYDIVKRKIEGLLKKEVLCVSELSMIEYAKYRKFDDAYL